MVFVGCEDVECGRLRLLSAAAFEAWRILT